MAAFEQFWMVFGGAGASPTVRHDSRPKAEREAARLARLHAGHAFFVLESVSRAIRVDVQIDRVNGSPADDDEIPF